MSGEVGDISRRRLKSYLIGTIIIIIVLAIIAAVGYYYIAKPSIPVVSGMWPRPEFEDYSRR